MKENKYDDDAFFAAYSQFPRSVDGLSAAGEWHALRAMLPDFAGKRVLDIGCGFGWHCIYAAEHGASDVLGIDISEKMLRRAKQMSTFPNVRYERAAMEDMAFADHSFDIVLSSLAFHYTENFPAVCQCIANSLSPDGDFVFSVEHPIFTAEGSQDWIYDQNGDPLHWPVDSYFDEGERKTQFLGEVVTKYHRTLTSYTSALLRCGFVITGIVEPPPDPRLLSIHGMTNELRRPMMLLFSAKKH